MLHILLFYRNTGTSHETITHVTCVVQCFNSCFSCLVNFVVQGEESPTIVAFVT